MLAFAIPVLVHDPAFTNHEDICQLKQIEKCLRFILEPLMAKKDAFSYGLYKNMIEMMKNHQDSTPNAEDNSYNFVSLVKYLSLSAVVVNLCELEIYGFCFLFSYRKCGLLVISLCILSIQKLVIVN